MDAAKQAGETASARRRRRRRGQQPDAAEKPRRAVPAEQVQAELGPGQTVELLQALHLLTRGGTMNADALRKLKQVNHLMGLLRPALEGLLAQHDDPLLVDAGAGNGYLDFMVHEAFLRPAGRGHILAIERRADLCARAQARADDLGMDRIAFRAAAVADLIATGAAEAAFGDDPVRAVLALHACDRATDEAIVLGIRQQAEVIAVVPCCQAEVAALLQGAATRGPIAPLWRHGLHRRELGAHLTNVIRALVLEAHGYKVRVTELVGWEHSLKNELILAVRHQRGNGAARRQLDAMLAELPPLPMWLLQELAGDATSAPDDGDPAGGDDERA